MKEKKIEKDDNVWCTDEKDDKVRYTTWGVLSYN